jgi:hypothetical protein
VLWQICKRQLVRNRWLGQLGTAAAAMAAHQLQTLPADHQQQQQQQQQQQRRWQYLLLPQI